MLRTKSDEPLRKKDKIENSLNNIKQWNLLWPFNKIKFRDIFYSWDTF